MITTIATTASSCCSLQTPSRLSGCLSDCSNKVTHERWRRRMPELWSVCSGLAKITLAYSQCLGAISRLTLVKWPQLFHDFAEALDVVNLEATEGGLD